MTSISVQTLEHLETLALGRDGETKENSNASRKDFIFRESLTHYNKFRITNKTQLHRSIYLRYDINVIIHYT